jgi:ATP-dependent Clp protease adaptor protein ClpS
MLMKTQQEQEVELLEDTDIEDPKDLIVFNDDVNTFDHVIETLIKVCRHTPEQAEQCTILIHYKGKCAVKNGPYEKLKPMRNAICDRGISAEIS